MSRITQTSAAFLALALVGITSAQTSTQNAQRPQVKVEDGRTKKEVLRDASKIDALLTRGLKRHQEVALPLVDDQTFVRRTYLNVTGRIPTLAETEKFLANQNPDKRTELVDLLLNSPGHTSHFSNYWFDLLRVKSRQRQLSGEPFAHFIRQSIIEDKPYDEFVRELLVAEGAAHATNNGATGHLMRDTGMPHDSMANTVRLFLGTRLECAQCHNHPFDHWTQKQFFEMAAFFGSMRYRDNRVLGSYSNMRKELANEDQRTRQAALRLVRRLTQGIQGNGSGIEKLPKDYQYDDARPMAPIKASTLFGNKVKLSYPKTSSRSQSKRARAQRRKRAVLAEGINSREALADWMTDKKNPQFAMVIANRMWARTFGRGLIEPRDDWKKDTVAIHPELARELEKLMVRVDFNLRQFERVLLHTQLFQQEADKKDPLPGTAPLFTGPVMRRMSSQQVWDSLLTLVFDDIDDRLRAPDSRASDIYASYEQVRGADKDEILKIVKGGRSMMRQNKSTERRKEMLAQKARERSARKRAQPLMRKLTAARRDGDLTRVAKIRKQLEQMGLNPGQRASKGFEADLLRASDLDQPARLGHVLREFGQSDRETIDASSDVATVPQVLTLMNGFLDQRVLNGESALRRDLQFAPDGERRIRVAFLTTLNREPTKQELDSWRRQVAVNGSKTLNDLVWVLCNSNEFRFVQ